MTLIITDGENKSVPIKKEEFGDEGQLQKAIKNYPDIVPVYEISEDKKLFVGSREFPVNAGSADAVAVDKDGDLYVIEAKLKRNHTRREVIAQALDYGAALWKHFNNFREMINIFDKETKATLGKSFEEAIKEEFNFDSDHYKMFLNELEMNLDKGVFKFVIVMDQIEERLKDMITYINRNSNFDIFAVRVELYNFEKRKILIPKMFGVETKKNLGVASGKRGSWDEQGFIERTRETLGVDAVKVLKLYEYFKEIADDIVFGTGTKNPSFAPMFYAIHKKTALFSFFSDGIFMVKFGWFSHASEESQAIVKKSAKIFVNEITTRTNIEIPSNYMKKSFSIKKKDFFENYDSIKRAIQKVIEYVKSIDEEQKN